MKILVLSDSHAGLSFMRQCITKTKPDAVVHLGDYFDDGSTMAEEFPHLNFLQVPGNCDRYRCPPGYPEVLSVPVCGVKLYMTHGHRHRVKSGMDSLLEDARASKAAGVLFGHTHQACCRQESDGLWVLNPGVGGSFGGSAGLIYTEDGKIVNCCLITQMDLEEMK